MSRSVQVKTLKGENFSIEVAEQASISDVKSKISEQRGVDPSTQVLICAGKTLQDDASLASSLGNNGFLVLMVKAKRRAAPAPSAAASSSTAASSASSSSTPAGAAAAATATTAAAAAAAAAPTRPSASPQSSAAPTPQPAAAAVSGGGGGGAGEGGLVADSAAVEQLVAMGFPEEQAKAALLAAFNDVSRAAGYLMEGIPDEAMGGADGGQGTGGADLEAMMNARAMAMGEEGDGEDDEEGALMGLMGEGNPLNFMRFHPQFDQLRDLVRENPAMLPQMLQQLGNQSPELMEQINAHPDDFLRLMNEPPDMQGQAMMDLGLQGSMEDEDDDDEDGSEGENAGQEAGGEDQGSGRSYAINLTDEEDAAIATLMAMVPGVGRERVVEAYITCDKNVEMAANFLFENI